MLFEPLVGRPALETSMCSSGIETILRAVRTHLGMDVGFVSEFSNGRRVFRHVESADGKQCIDVGSSDPLDQSYCHWVVEGRLPQLIRDPADHPFARSLPATKAVPVGAHLSVPIRLRDGRVYGTFCCFSMAPDPSLTERDLSVLRAFAQVAQEQVQQCLDEEEDRQQKLGRIAAVLAERDLEIVYQPAIRLDSPEVAFVEALARFSSDPYEPPNRWFEAAADVGLAVQLEILAITKALEGLEVIPNRSSMSINVSPETILSGELGPALASAPLERIILEITEHAAITSYPAIADVLAPLRGRGLRIAVDDTGAGYSSFRHILQMRPDMIKLDMSISRGIDRDPVRRALASALIAFAGEIGSELVAEGVETPAELRSLRELGVTVVQGHLMARPAHARELN